MTRKNTKGITVSVPADQAAIAVLPNESNIQSDIKIGVSKAEMASILTIKIQESLQNEVDQAKNAIFLINQEISKVISKTQIEGEKKLRKKIPKFLENSVWRFQCESVATDRISNPAEKELLKNSLRMLLSVGNNDVYNRDCTVVPLEDEVTIKFQYVCISSTEYVPGLKELKEKHRTAEEVLKEIESRRDKANDSKYVTAQLNMSILASSKNGDQLVKNMNSIANNLVNTVFSKKDPIPELTNSQ